MNPPSALHGAMGRERKPFTYTPGGLDLSEIKSERMAKRLMRNAMNQGVPETPVQQVQSPPANPIMVPNFNCLPVQVFPTINLPANPKSLLRTRSNPGPREAPVQRVPPPQPNQFPKPNRPENTTSSFAQVNNNNSSYQKPDNPTSVYSPVNNSYQKPENQPETFSVNNNGSNYQRPVSMFEYNTPSNNSNTLSNTSYGNNEQLPFLPEICYQAEYFQACPRNVVNEPVVPEFKYDKPIASDNYATFDLETKQRNVNDNANLFQSPVPSSNGFSAVIAQLESKHDNKISSANGNIVSVEPYKQNDYNEGYRIPDMDISVKSEIISPNHNENNDFKIPDLNISLKTEFIDSREGNDSLTIPYKSQITDVNLEQSNNNAFLKIENETQELLQNTAANNNQMDLDFSIQPISLERIPSPFEKPVQEESRSDDEQKVVKVVKKQVKKESKSEVQNGNQNGDQEAQMTVKLPAKKSAAKTETNVEVVKKHLPDGSIEEIKTTTTKTTVDGKTTISTKTETTIIPKEEEEEVEVEEEEEEEEETGVVEVVEENGDDEVVEEVVVLKKSPVVENGHKVVKQEERSETTVTKNVAVVQKQEEVEQQEKEEEEEIEEEEVVQEESKPEIVEEVKNVEEELEEEEEEVVEEKVEVKEQEVEEEEVVEEEAVEEAVEEEKVEKDEKPEEPAEEEEVEEEYEEAEEKVEEKVEKSKPSKEPEQEETEEEYEEEEEVKVEEAKPAPEEKNEEPETEEVKEEVVKEEVEVKPAEVKEIKIETQVAPKPEPTIPLREPSIPLEKVEEVEIKPIGAATETVTKSHSENTEIITSNERPSGPLSTQTEYKRIENIVSVNRTTKTLDHSYEQLTQQGVPTVKTYFAPPNIDRISTSPLPSRPYQSSYVPPADQPQERRHSLLLERLSTERQMPSELYQNNYQYNNQSYEQQTQQYSQEPQAEVLTVSNVKPSTITNSQWYQQQQQQQVKKDNVLYNNVTAPAPTPASQLWSQPQPTPQPQYQPPAQPSYQPPPQPQYQPSYTENIAQDKNTSAYQQTTYQPYSPKPTTWGPSTDSLSTSYNSQQNQYSSLNQSTTESYQKSTQQYSSSYVPPPWEQDSGYVADVSSQPQNYYQPPPPSNTFSPGSNQGWKPTPPKSKFTKPPPTAYIPPAPNQSFVRSANAEPPRASQGKKTYYSEYERRYITVPESNYIPGETKYQPQPDPSPQYYYDNNEPAEQVEPQWRKELREFTEKSSTQTTEQTSVRPPWEEDPKYAKPPSNVIYTATPTWSQTLRPRSWRERSFESEYVGSQEVSKTSTLGRGRPLSTYANNSVDTIPERPRGVSVDRYNPNNYQAPVAAEHPPVQTHTLTVVPPAKSYHNPNVPAYHAQSRASAEPREQIYPQARNWGESRASPIQSRSFKYLQWITGTDD